MNRDEDQLWRGYLKGLAMGALTTKRLAMTLAVLIALPVGICSATHRTPGPLPVAGNHCCHTANQHSPAPSTTSKTCCCQDRLNTTELIESREQVNSASFPIATTLDVDPELTRVQATSREATRAFYAQCKPCLQTRFCVWRE